MEMMFETYLSLVVPSDRQLREDIRQKVEHYFTLNKIVPPVSYNKLADLSDVLLTLNKWDKSNKAFVMVCCGNAIWRSVVGAIPYNRRMLLLPQCLKNSNMCQGRQDELGLLCSECGNCNISGFLQEAENLGYLTIVSEGTTIATRLVESGKVDAIIGVGCMEVLQKMFRAVNKYSIPAIGVPLLTCGCIDTTADAEWIKEEIHHLENNEDFRLINLNDLKDRTALLFNGNLIDQLLNLKQTPTDNIVREIMLAGGKRIRPLLTALAYEAISKKPDMEILKHLALSVECFHKASLIHDDIEDNDAFRYGKETIHIRYGIPVAINIGDLLIGEGYRLISECGLKPQVVMNCIKMVSRGHKDMSVGQGAELVARRSDDMVRLQEILKIFENKTAAAFRVSLLVGAIAAEAGEETINLLERFSNLIGIAYQIQDDLEDISADKDFSQLRNPSVLISLLTEKAIQSDRDKLPEILSQSDFPGLQVLFEKYAIPQITTDIIKDYLQRIDSCLVNIQNIQLKLALYEIVGKTFRDYL
jgi:geranylgeranyl diphosphate synthase, type II